MKCPPAISPLVAPPMSDSPTHLLDRQIWNALTTRQAALAAGGHLAVRLDPQFGPFAATRDESPESFAALHALARSTGDFVLFTPAAPTLPETFKVSMASQLDQFVDIAPSRIARRTDIRALSSEDVPEMLALTELTKPGPFLPRTHELGAFYGVRINGRLAAMTGERLKLPGHTEITAVCTHPDFRGMGLAAALIACVADEIQTRGETPFLHVFSHNASAIAVYRRLGMTFRRAFAVTVVRAV
jgi:predicted GNAT family acetyltransferase